MIHRILFSFAFLFTSVVHADTYISVPSNLTWLRCYYMAYGSASEHWNDFYARTMRPKGDLTVTREEPPDNRYVLTFDLQVPKYHCSRLEWSIRPDLQTTGAAP